MHVPFIDLKRFEPNFLEKWSEKVSFLSSRASFMCGEEVELLEQNLANLTENKYSISCANGTDAMQLALRALNIRNGDKVLLPNFTFWATFEAIVNVGAVPITVDCEMCDGGMSLKYFIEAVDRYKPKAAILAHLFGWSSRNLQKIRDCANRNNVALLEDGAQCFGSKFNGEAIYKRALISTTSFYPSKVLGAAGDGGAIFTNDKDLAFKVRQLANHGRSDHFAHVDVGWNSRLGSLQAAYLNITLAHFSDRIISRKKSLAIYKENLNYEIIKQISAPSQIDANGYCNVSYIEQLNFKRKLEEELFNNKIGFGNIYPATISNQKGASNYLLSHVGGDEAHKICSSVLNLPLFPYMTGPEIYWVIEIVEKTIQSYLENKKI